MSLRRPFSHWVNLSCLVLSSAQRFVSDERAVTFNSSPSFINVSICLKVDLIIFCSLRYFSICREYTLSFCFDNHSVFSLISLNVTSFSSRWLLNCCIVFRSYPALQLE